MPRVGPSPFDGPGTATPSTVPVMSTNQKPDVEVPAEQPPSYQLELEDIIVGDGDEAVCGRIVEVH